MIKEIVISEYGEVHIKENSSFSFTKEIVYKLSFVDKEPIVKKLIIPPEFVRRFRSFSDVQKLIIKMLRNNSKYFYFEDYKVIVCKENSESSLMKAKLKNDFKFFTLDKLLEIYDFYSED